MTRDEQPTLLGFDRGVTRSEQRGAPDGRRVRVLPDVVGIDKEFDYVIPDGVHVEVGDLVRVRLAGRPVGGWVTAVDVLVPDGVQPKAVTKVSGRGPTIEIVELSAWAAWRWAGRRPHLLRTASPPANVPALPAPVPPPDRLDAAQVERLPPYVTSALDSDEAVLRLAPGVDRYPLVRAAVSAPGPIPEARTLVLCPSWSEARALGGRLRREGITAAVLAGEKGSAGAGEWARARAGAVVVGTRAAAWAPLALGRVVVLDEHDEAYHGEQTPTWNARDVVIERARRAGVPCLLVSPTPSLEALAWGRLITTDRAVERGGWPRVEVVDQRDLDPTLGPLFSPALVRVVRSGRKVLCILNRTGRARMLACGTCSTLARCAVCDASVGQADRTDEGDVEELECRRCGARRPTVCLECGGTAFKQLRLGVTRAREELEVLAGAQVVEVSSSAADVPDLESAALAIGTEALLHRATKADVVAFLDFDQELLATRYRTGEQALGLLARAGRLVSRSRSRGSLLVQTRTPDHPVLQAAVHADPSRFSDGEGSLRSALLLPPASALALVSGEAAEAFVAGVRRGGGVQVQGPVDGTWRLRAPDHEVLCDSVAAARRPPGRLRIEVDPVRA